MRLAASARPAAPRAAMASVQPSPAKNSAQARPMPLLPPVMRTRLPVRRRSMRSVRCRAGSAHHLAPAGHLPAHVAGELLRGVGHDVGALAGEELAQLPGL